MRSSPGDAKLWWVKQQLRGLPPVVAEVVAVVLHQPGLADAGEQLQFQRVGRPLVVVGDLHAGGDRPGADQHHAVAGIEQRGDFRALGNQEHVVEPPGGADQSAADLDQARHVVNSSNRYSRTPLS